MIRRTFLAALASVFAPKAEAKPAYRKAVVLALSDEFVLVLLDSPNSTVDYHFHDDEIDAHILIVLDGYHLIQYIAVYPDGEWHY